MVEMINGDPLDGTTHSLHLLYQRKWDISFVRINKNENFIANFLEFSKFNLFKTVVVYEDIPATLLLVHTILSNVNPKV
jgi:hypothetical protein